MGRDLERIKLKKYCSYHFILKIYNTFLDVKNTCLSFNSLSDSTVKERMKDE